MVTPPPPQVGRSSKATLSVPNFDQMSDASIEKVSLFFK